ncbi:MAG: hypothetical protein HW421_3790 [Ignavibacteria bacterium]|nr:hypothetical protein [Ignavibacteria bacterium]
MQKLTYFPIITPAVNWGEIGGNLSQQQDLKSVLDAKEPIQTSQQNIIYVGKHGSDSNDGKSIQNAKLTFENAIESITDNSSSKRYTVTCFDSGIYTPALSVRIPDPRTNTGSTTGAILETKPFVDIFAPNAKLLGLLLLSDNSSVELGEVECQAPDNSQDYLIGSAVIKSSTNQSGIESTDVSFVRISKVSTRGGSAFANWSEEGILFIKCEIVNVEDGNYAAAAIGITCNGNQGSIFGEIGRIELFGTMGNAGIASAGNLVFNGIIGSIQKDSGASQTIGLSLKPESGCEQKVNININTINCDTAYDISPVHSSASVEINDYVGESSGNIITGSTGTISKNIVIANDVVLLNGRNGGQSLKGGVQASENLILSSSAHSTKGKVLIGSSAYDEANNRLGIGTANPVYSLDVESNAGSGISAKVGNTATSYSSINFYNTGSNQNLLVGANGNDLFIQTATTERIRIKADSGNVGIGTSNPGNILSFGGNSARILWLERHTTSNTAGNNLTIQAGGATSGATDKTGGDLLLAAGLSTGKADSSVKLQCSQQITSGNVKTVSIANGGTGYSVGNTLTILSGGGNCTLTVTSVSGGVVTGVSIAIAGTAYSIGNDYSTSVAPVGGTGCTINVTDITGTADNAAATMFQILGNKIGFYGSSPAERPAGYSVTNKTTDRTFDANSTSLEEIADVLATLIDDLKGLGLIA